MSSIIHENILQVGDPLLREVSKTVTEFDSYETIEIITNLIDTMRTQNLIGLSAIQLGYPLRIFVTEIRKTPYRNPRDTDVLRVFINPEILSLSPEQSIMYEGCGSIASSGLFAPIERPEKVTIRAYYRNGEIFEMEADGLLARVIQHEYDHLDGVLFTDKIDDMKSIMSASEYKKTLS